MTLECYSSVPSININLAFWVLTSARISYNPTAIIDPCNPPTVSFTLNEVNRNDATHELRGSISGVKKKAGISLTFDGNANEGFLFVPARGDLSAKFKLSPGSHTIVVSANNACGEDSKSASVTVEEEACDPGSMGHWSVCNSADKEPVSWNGKNRPKSPCEVVNDEGLKGKGIKR